MWDLNQLHLGLELDPPPNPPDDPDDPEPNVAAFDEPDAICNSYVDVYIQKTLYRATHSAL
jgi:hypothetical protein